MRTAFQLEYDGRHYINSCDGPIILAGNHTGWLDTLAVVTASNRRVRFLVNKDILSWPLIGKLIHAVGGIKVSPKQGVYAIDEAVECLSNGESVCIFPEGKLTVDGNIARFRNGVARLQKDSGCPVIPFAIYGGYEAWPYSRRLPRLHKMAIHFGVPLSQAQLESPEITRELEDMVGYMKTSLERRFGSDKQHAESLLNLLQAKSDAFSARPALAIKEKDRFYEISYAGLSRQAIRLSSYLMEIGIERGDRVAILSESRPEVAICIFGSLRAGATIVPLDAKLTSREINELINDCTPNTLFVSEHLLSHYEEVKDSLPSLQHCFVIDHDCNASSYPAVASLIPKAKLPSRERSLDEVGLIIYTSGTTGSPKGVLTTIGNLVFQARQFEKIVSPREGDRFLSILPLNHLLELTHGFLGVLHAGGTIYYSHSLNPREIAALMKEKRITAMIAVPLFYKMLKTGIEREAMKGNAIARTWWHVAISLSRLLTSQPVRRFLFAPLHKSLGGKLRMLISGGAPLEEATAHFFDSIGITMLEGYGLTETSPVITCNTPWANKFGSVGPPIPGVEIKIEAAEIGTADDSKDGSKENFDGDSKEGEILTRGPHIMKGYYKQDALTAEVIDGNGWLHTGDIGKIDEQGYLHITGRMKNLIVLGGGKKVHPEEVEGVLSACPEVKELCVLGTKIEGGAKEGTEEVCAVVVPTDAFVHEHPERAGMEKALTSELQDLASQLASYKRPTRFVVTDVELPKTTTRKVKRKELLELIYQGRL